MSKQNKHRNANTKISIAARNAAARRQRNTIIGIVVGVGALLLAVVVIWLATRSSGETTVNPISASGPKIAVDNRVVDHGTVKFENFVESVYKVRNIGNQPLIFQGIPRVELIEGC